MIWCWLKGFLDVDDLTADQVRTNTGMIIDSPLVQLVRRLNTWMGSTR